MMDCVEVRFSKHAVSRMFERSFSRDDVLTAILQGRVIADYLEDRPYPAVCCWPTLEPAPFMW